MTRKEDDLNMGAIVLIPLMLIAGALVILNIKESFSLRRTTNRIKYCEDIGLQFSIANKEQNLPDRCYDNTGVKYWF